MSRRMLKFALFDIDSFSDDQVTLELPPSSGMECVGMQGGTLMLWQLCVEGLQPQPRTFLVAGTGHVLPEGDLRYVGTVFDSGYVWHIFEVMRG